MSIEVSQKSSRLDVNSTTSARKGLGGALERGLRKLRGIIHGLILIPFYGIACLCIGAALVPAFYIYHLLEQLTALSTPVIHYFAQGTALAAGFYTTGFSLLFLLPAVNFVFRANLKPWRGPYYSLETVNWYIHNGAVYLLRYSFMEFITPSPFSNWFYQMMGMKIGRGTIINSTNISDPSLIELGAKVTIGGSATIVAHYGQGGYLVLAPVKIGDGSTIGLKATIMGGVTIGKNAKLLPNSVVLPNTTIPDGETWGGVPAQKLSILSTRTAA